MTSRARGTLLVAGLLALTAVEARAQNFDTVTVTTAHLAEGVHVLFGAGGNVGVSVGPDGVILIDDIRAFHVAPAHTDGDAVVHWKRANVIHAGDLFFNGFYPFFDPDQFVELVYHTIGR